MASERGDEFAGDPRNEDAQPAANPEAQAAPAAPGTADATPVDVTPVRRSNVHTESEASAKAAFHLMYREFADLPRQCKPVSAKIYQGEI